MAGNKAGSSRIVQLLGAGLISGGDNSVPHGRGRSTVEAWGLCQDGAVVALVREGGVLVRAEVPEVEVPEVVPEVEVVEPPTEETTPDPVVPGPIAS